MTEINSLMQFTTSILTIKDFLLGYFKIVDLILLNVVLHVWAITARVFLKLTIFDLENRTKLSYTI